MLSHCANTQCSSPFVRLGQGRLFLVEAIPLMERTNQPSSQGRRPPRRVERYWLCERCSELSTLVVGGTAGVTLVPLPPLQKERLASP